MLEQHLSQAAATFEAYVRRPDAYGFSELQVTRAGDRDGDGELAAGVSVSPSYPLAFEVALVSGSRQRSSGPVTFHDPGQPFEERSAFLQGLFPVGDLDGDGATELVSVSSSILFENGYDRATREEFHIHYGTPGGQSSSPPR